LEIEPMPSPARAERTQGPARARASGSSRRAPQRKDPAGGARNSLIADFRAICGLDPTIEALRSPAEPAVFEVGDDRIEHVADFEIVRDGETALVDVVPDADLIDHPLGAALIGGAVSTDGRRLLVETGSSLRAEPRHTTVKLVMACRWAPVGAGDRVRILHHLDECGTAPLVECAAVVQNAMDGVAAVLALAVEGLIEIDVNRPILPETTVRRRKLVVPD